jgi:hypothetical protein
LQELNDELAQEKKAADNTAQTAADLKVTIAALQAAITDVQKNLDQFKKEWKALQDQADKDHKRFGHELSAAVSALGGKDRADAVEQEWQRFQQKGYIGPAQQKVDDLQAQVSGEGTLEQALQDATDKKADAQAAYDGLKVATLKANLQALEKLLDEANALGLPGDADAGTYYLLKALAEPLTGAPTTIPDPAAYEKALVKAYDDLADATKAQRVAQAKLDQANKDLAAAQKDLAARQANLKQATLDDLKGFTPQQPAKPTQQKTS